LVSGFLAVGEQVFDLDEKDPSVVVIGGGRNTGSCPRKTGRTVNAPAAPWPVPASCKQSSL
jgi:hypothetical protein